MISYQMDKKRPQLNLSPSGALINRLEDLSERYKGDRTRRNEVAIEILERYNWRWERDFLKEANANDDADNYETGQIATDGKKVAVRLRTLTPRKKARDKERKAQ